MSDEKLKEEIKQVVTNLGNIKFTVEDELEFCKQVLKRKEQECEKAKQNAQDTYDLWQALTESFNILQVEKIKLDGAITYLKKENKELSKIIDCKNGTVLSLKQQLDQLKAENEELKRQLEVKGNILKLTDETKNEYLKENQKLKQTLTEIKEIATCCIGGDVAKIRMKQILQKINECEVENG